MTRKIQLLGKRGRLVGTVQERENQSSGTIEKREGAVVRASPFLGLHSAPPNHLLSLFCNSAAWLIFPLLHCTYCSPSLPQKWKLSLPCSTTFCWGWTQRDLYSSTKVVHDLCNPVKSNCFLRRKLKNKKTMVWYISTSIWVLRTPNTGWNSHFQHF